MTSATHTTISRLGGTFGLVQIVTGAAATVAGEPGIRLDIQTRGYDVAGSLLREHACAALSVRDAVRLHELLGVALASMQPPLIWPAAHLRRAA